MSEPPNWYYAEEQMRRAVAEGGHREAIGGLWDELGEHQLGFLIREGMKPHHKLLDIGCGWGGLALYLAEQCGAEVTGVDADLRMLAAARNRAAQAGLAIEFIEGDVRQLPFSDQTFDIVVAVTVLCFVSDPVRAISEITRVLKTGGRLIIGELGRYSLWAVKRRIAGWFGSRTWRAASFLSPRQMQRLVANAGLIVEETRGAIYYPPYNLCAHWLAPFDARISGVTMTGAAFIALAARKP